MRMLWKSIRYINSSRSEIWKLKKGVIACLDNGMVACLD